MAIDVNSMLGSDEGIVSEYHSGKNNYYVTDRRLIFTRKGHLEDAAYNHITRISMDKVGHKLLIALGILLFFIGIVIAAAGPLSGGITLLVIGLIIIVLYFVLKGSVYSLSLSSGEKLYVPKAKSSDVVSFIKAIRDEMR